MQQILDAILVRRPRPRRTSPRSTVPETYRAATVHKDEVDMFEGLASQDKDPRKSLHVEEVPLPELGPGEALVAVMASADQLQHRVDLDLRAGVDVRLPRALRPDLARWPSGTTCRTTSSAPTWPASCSRTGPGVHAWKPGDEVVAHCLSVELESPDGHNDTMLDPEQRIWGFETNFGGLAELALVKSNQLMPKPGAPDLGGGRRPPGWSTPRRTASWSAATAPA